MVSHGNFLGCSWDFETTGGYHLKVRCGTYRSPTRTKEGDPETSLLFFTGRHKIFPVKSSRKRRSSLPVWTKRGYAPEKALVKGVSIAVGVGGGTTCQRDEAACGEGGTKF